MKSWSVAELDNVVASLKPLVGARLQEIKSSGHDVVLGFYSHGQILWLWFDLNAVRPSLLPWTDLPLSVANKKTPMQLFLRAHFDGRILHRLERVESMGRAVSLDFGPGYRIDVRLFPHGVNFSASANGKTIHWQKPMPVPPPLTPIPELTVRGLDELREQWQASRKVGGGKKGKDHDPAERIRREIQRRQKALLKVEEELARKSELPWREIGVWLQTNQSLKVPDEWTPFIDKRRKLSWNIEQCFTKARETEGKLHGTEQRKAKLLSEITKLEQESRKPKGLGEDKPQMVADDPLKNSGVDGRSFKINQEVTAFAGKNAADNMKLLRRARPWDFWLHVQDQPSAHVIVFRNKSTSVSDAVLRDIIGWMLKLQLGPKLAKHSKEKFKVIVAECRHVRPIKGDRLGRVHYQNERILIYQIP